MRVGRILVYLRGAIARAEELDTKAWFQLIRLVMAGMDEARRIRSARSEDSTAEIRIREEITGDWIWCGRAVGIPYTRVMSIVRNAAAIAKGMSITFREMFQPTEVENYPDGKGPTRGAVLQERFRGAHVLQRDENGLEKCVACFLCAAACPSNCIFIEAAENTAETRISSAERYAKTYNIDYNRCIFCGYCVEACPTDAITHGHGFELASLNATNLVMRKEDMLVQAVGMPGQLAAQSDSVK